MCCMKCCSFDNGIVGVGKGSVVVGLVGRNYVDSVLLVDGDFFYFY